MSRKPDQKVTGTRDHIDYLLDISSITALLLLSCSGPEFSIIYLTSIKLLELRILPSLLPYSLATSTRQPRLHSFDLLTQVRHTRMIMS